MNIHSEDTEISDVTKLERFLEFMGVSTHDKAYINKLGGMYLI